MVAVLSPTTYQKEVIKKMKNREIRQAATQKGVRHWQIAEALGVHETTFVRHMRSEFPRDEKERILAIINELSREVR